ncbi:carbohydrate-binding module family 14 protein [Nocardia sp. NPDC049149]|uniref:carbohydrate-binding module family 14 protein n=1 Tax=Nocardia sp. NPDC049149 TaxID=3364315 RepID=UPI0037126F8B
MAGFDINDRSSWNWVNGGEVTCELSWDQDEYHLDPESAVHFYQCSNGVPHRQPCGPGMVFNPRLMVCDHPQGNSEAEIYDWAVKIGQVAPDQR